MKSANTNNNNNTIARRIQTPVLLFLAAFFLYALASPGNIPGDTEVRWSVARQIIRHQTVVLEDSICAVNRNYAVAPNGKNYCFWGPGQSIAMLPFAAVGFALEKTQLLNPKTADLLAQFLTLMTFFPFISALSVWLINRLLLLLGYSKKVSILVAALFAFATMNFHYSEILQEQSQITALLLTAMIFWIKSRSQRRFLHAWLFSLSLGTCLLFRISSAIVIFPMFLVAAGEEIFAHSNISRTKRMIKWLTAGFCGTAAVIIFLAWYNYIRFDSILESGYGLCAARAIGGHGLFESKPIPTIAAMLFSPGKSIFLYNPILLALPFCIVGFTKRHKAPALMIAVAVAANFIFHSFHTTWAGDYAWSIRYQVPILGFLVLPLAHLFSRQLKTAAKTLIIILISASCIVQLASVTYKCNLEFTQNPNHNIIPDDYIWDWSQSHLFWRFDNIWDHITANRNFSSTPVTDPEPLILKRNYDESSVREAYNINFFPFKAAATSDSNKLFYPLLTLWLALLTAFAISITKLINLHLPKKHS